MIMKKKKTIENIVGIDTLKKSSYKAMFFYSVTKKQQKKKRTGHFFLFLKKRFLRQKYSELFRVTTIQYSLFSILVVVLFTYLDTHLDTTSSV